jgi:hypothetical protein
MARKGSINRLDIFGIPYDVVADAEPNKKPKVEKETKASTGKPLVTATKMVPQIEAITTSLSSKEYDTLDTAAANGDKGPLAITMADGSVWRDEGEIAIGEYNANAGTADITLIPDTEFALI